MYDQPPLSQVNEVFYFSLNKKMNRPCPDALLSRGIKIPRLAVFVILIT